MEHRTWNLIADSICLDEARQAEVDEPDAKMSVDAGSRQVSGKLSRALLAAKHTISLTYTMHTRCGYSILQYCNYHLARV